MNSLSSVPPPPDWPAIVVHGLDHALMVLAQGRPVMLLSAPGAALAGGCGWWHAMMQAARHAVPDARMTDVLDCADAPGAAMAALRLGQACLILDPAVPAFARVAAAAALQGARVLKLRPAALDLAERGAQRHLSAYLAGHTPRDSTVMLR
jgi:hypothetical protein